MTELIVALDGAQPVDLMFRLNAIGIRWFKVGPLTELDGRSLDKLDGLSGSRVISDSLKFNLFRDAKLADHGPYVISEYVKRLADKGYAAVSTSTDEATMTAVNAAMHFPPSIWKHIAPTSQKPIGEDIVIRVKRALDQGVDGVILSAHDVPLIKQYAFNHGLVTVCPGIRLFEDQDEQNLVMSGHYRTAVPERCVVRGVDFAVVGRPIHASSDPELAAKRYLSALRG